MGKKSRRKGQVVRASSRAPSDDVGIDSSASNVDGPPREEYHFAEFVNPLDNLTPEEKALYLAQLERTLKQRWRVVVRHCSRYFNRRARSNPGNQSTTTSAASTTTTTINANDTPSVVTPSPAEAPILNVDIEAPTHSISEEDGVGAETFTIAPCSTPSASDDSGFSIAPFVVSEDLPLAKVRVPPVPTAEVQLGSDDSSLEPPSTQVMVDIEAPIIVEPRPRTSSIAINVEKSSGEGTSSSVPHSSNGALPTADRLLPHGTASKLLGGIRRAVGICFVLLGAFVICADIYGRARALCSDATDSSEAYGSRVGAEARMVLVQEAASVSDDPSHSISILSFLVASALIGIGSILAGSRGAGSRGGNYAKNAPEFIAAVKTHWDDKLKAKIEPEGASKAKKMTDSHLRPVAALYLTHNRSHAEERGWDLSSIQSVDDFDKPENSSLYRNVKNHCSDHIRNHLKTMTTKKSTSKYTGAREAGSAVLSTKNIISGAALSANAVARRRADRTNNCRQWRNDMDDDQRARNAEAMRRAQNVSVFTHFLVQLKMKQSAVNASDTPLSTDENTLVSNTIGTLVRGIREMKKHQFNENHDELLEVAKGLYSSIEPARTLLGVVNSSTLYRRQRIAAAAKSSAGVSSAAAAKPSIGSPPKPPADGKVADLSGGDEDENSDDEGSSTSTELHSDSSSISASPDAIGAAGSTISISQSKAPAQKQSGKKRKFDDTIQEASSRDDVVAEVDEILGTTFKELVNSNPNNVPAPILALIGDKTVSDVLVDNLEDVISSIPNDVDSSDSAEVVNNTAYLGLSALRNFLQGRREELRFLCNDPNPIIVGKGGGRLSIDAAVNDHGFFSLGLAFCDDKHYIRLMEANSIERLKKARTNEEGCLMKGNFGSRYLGVKEATVWFLTCSLDAPSHIMRGDLLLRPTSIRPRKPSGRKSLLPVAKESSKPKATATAFSAGPPSVNAASGFPRSNSRKKLPVATGKENTQQQPSVDDGAKPASAIQLAPPTTAASAIQLASPTTAAAMPDAEQPMATSFMEVDKVEQAAFRSLKDRKLLNRPTGKLHLKYLRERCDEFQIQCAPSEQPKDLAPRLAKEIMRRPDDVFWSIRAPYWNRYFPLHHRRKVLV